MARTQNKKVNSEEIYWCKQIQSPLGVLELVANENSLTMVLIETDSRDQFNKLTLKDGRHHKVLQAAEKQLNEYFLGRRKTFDLPLELKGTEFQKQVWNQLLKIPYGKHITYGFQAAQIGRPKAVRAVGASNGKNPIPIIVPCHRVIGSSGALIGYAGGLPVKRFLLKLEGVDLK